VDSIPSSRPRQALLAALSVIIGVAVSLAMLEGILRFLPVRNGPRTLPVNAANPVIRYTPNRAYTFSVGWRFTIVNRGRTNNYGFVNDWDYDSASHAPLLAVVGDSYIEAFMVPFPETLQGRLASCVGERGRVYSFGASGAALSDYLVEADFARTRFRPQGLVVVVIANDYRESLMRDKPRPRFTYFERDPADSNKLRLRRIDYAPGLLRRLTRPSALIRYFLYNADVPSALARLWASWVIQPGWRCKSRPARERLIRCFSAIRDWPWRNSWPSCPCDPVLTGHTSRSWWMAGAQISTVTRRRSPPGTTLV